MEENYYDSILRQLRADILAGKYESAESILEEELRMPYIPAAPKKEMEALMREVRAWRKQNRRKARIDDVGELLEMLDNEAGHIAVVSALDGLNLREFDEVLKKAFSVITDRGLLSVLVELCARQQLHNEYSFTFDHVTYTFIPAALELPEESEGVDACLKQAQDWLGNDDPSMLVLAQEAILRIALLRLPEGIDIDEALPLTLGVVKNLFYQISGVQEWHAFCEKNTIDENRIEAVGSEVLI